MEVKVALVTGGSSGIGAATARLLADAGVKVYAGSRRGTFEPAREDVIPVKLDVNDAATLEAAVQEILSREGRLDAVVCNAGNGIYGPVEGTTEEEARYQFETNYFGVLKTIQACLPVFRKQQFGRIITITSVMAILDHKLAHHEVEGAGEAQGDEVTDNDTLPGMRRKRIPYRPSSVTT